MNTQNLYVDFHILQTVPPSCVNRDDTGSPKTAIYGGTTRARVSSQAWKKAVRAMFAENACGFRTRNAEKLIADEIQKQNDSLTEETARELASKMLAAGKAKGEGKDVLFFISRAQVQALASLALKYYLDTEVYGEKKDHEKKKDAFYAKLAQDSLVQNPSIDMALFGRMAASNTALNYDAACQVAHAISTHTVTTEFDYFTAVDDCKESEDAGAGHLGTVEFNSSTLYRYATLSVSGLEKYIAEKELSEAVKMFADAFIRSMPTGKQNSFANRTIPDMVYVTLRQDQPVNLVGAFEKPVYAGNEGYVVKSEARLEQYAQSVYESFVPAPEQAWCVGEKTEALGEKVSLPELLAQLKLAIDEHVKG